jgi:FHS family L-fucose permease-like MFS transporter
VHDIVEQNAGSDMSSSSGVAKPGVQGSAFMVPLVIFLFFAWGFTTSLNDPLIAKLKGLFSLSYAEVMLTQSAFFLGYCVFSIPSGIVLARVGYVRTIALGLAVMAIGCLLFAPAAMTGIYPSFLGALFIVAAGMALLQVAANPYIAVLGSPKNASSRLTFAQSFNSLGTFLGPLVGALFLLQRGVATPIGVNEAALKAARIAEASLVQIPFLVIAAVLLAFALLFWFLRGAPSAPTELADVNPFSLKLLRRPRLMLGVIAIFLYVGAEVAIGSGLTNYLMQSSVVGDQAADIGQHVSAVLGRIFHRHWSFNVAQVAGAMVSLYWGLAMVGRFIGSAVLSLLKPSRVLTFNALLAIVLAVISSQTAGITAAATVLAIGLANSIMFPTIFTLALEGLGADTSKGSGLLCTAIVGGSVIPYAYGWAADLHGLAAALLIPAACYLFIAGYGLFALRDAARTSA